MDRDKILEMSRRENRNKDEMEKDIFAKAGQKACAVGGIVCAVIIVLEALLSDYVNLSTWAVYLSMTGTMLLVKYTKLKRLHELIFALVQLILAALFLVMHVIRLV